MNRPKASNSFTILFTASLLSQLKTSLTTSQLSSLLIKINELNPNNIIDIPDEDGIVKERYSVFGARCSEKIRTPNTEHREPIFRRYNPVKLIQMASEKCGFAMPQSAILNIPQAKEKAAQWLENGIFVLFQGQEVLFAQGNIKLLNSSTAAILNSRKIRMVIPSSRWLKVTINLTKQAIAKEFTIVSSLGMLTYEIVTFIVNKHHSPLIIVLDGYLPAALSSDLQKGFYDKFSNMFDPNNTLFISPFWQGLPLPSRKERLVKRDYWVVDLAANLFVGESRAEGNIQNLVSKAISEGRKVSVFRPVKFDLQTKGNQKLLLAGGQEVICDLDAQTCLEIGNKENDFQQWEITKQLSVNFSDYLFHYTRACPGPWPGQSLAEYIQSLVDGNLDAGHNAFDTMCRILKEQLIRASNRLVRGQMPVVSFTACSPDELAKIRKWNSALIRWTFESYGIGIRKDILKKMGIQPVIYAQEEEFRKLSVNDKFRFQLHQPPKTDWSLEKEWRMPQDVSLTYLSLEDMVIVVTTPQEAAIIQKNFSLPVIHL